MSERYIQPPPPYQFSVQLDHKVAEEVQALELSKAGRFRGGEWNDFKHPRVLADIPLEGAAAHTLAGAPKRPPRSDGASLQARRPLPSRPIDIHTLGPQGRGNKSRSDAEPYAAHYDHKTELFSSASPPFSAITRGTSVQPSPMHHPSQSLCDTPHRKCDDRRLLSSCSSVDLRAKTTSRRSSHMSFQSPSYPSPQKNNSGARLLFDPSIAYSDSQVNVRTFSMRRGAAASLYSSAVSSHVPDSTLTYGSRQSYVPPRPMMLNTETPCRDLQSLQSLSSDSLCSLSPTSSYTRMPETSGGYEQRWATSELDITKDVYRS